MLHRHQWWIVYRVKASMFILSLPRISRSKFNFNWSIFSDDLHLSRLHYSYWTRNSIYSPPLSLSLSLSLSLWRSFWLMKWITKPRLERSKVADGLWGPQAPALGQRAEERKARRERKEERERERREESEMTNGFSSAHSFHPLLDASLFLLVLTTRAHLGL